MTDQPTQTATQDQAPTDVESSPETSPETSFSAEPSPGADVSSGGPADDAAAGVETEAADPQEEADSQGAGEGSDELVREGEIAADFLETLLDIADLDGDLDVDVDGDRAIVSIVDSEEGRVPRRLVGQQGKVLEALQELARLAVQAETGERSRLMLDVAGYRADKRAQLVTLAQETVGKVKDTGERQSLDPMSAFERKVVHDAVLAAGLSSESEGVEPRRYVVVLPAN